MIYKTELKREPCDLPRLSMGDYVVFSVPEANTEITVKLGDARNTTCTGCPIARIRNDKRVIIGCNRANDGGLICSGGDFYEDDIADMLEEI